jgi:hypothetical protein
VMLEDERECFSITPHTTATGARTKKTRSESSKGTGAQLINKESHKKKS